jgi:hypothetical protein
MEDNICIICLENIENEFYILNCYCKSKLYHNECINELFKKQLRCPLCRYIFPRKPYKKLNIRILRNRIIPITNNNIQIFATNFNILRIMSGMRSLSYSN